MKKIYPRKIVCSPFSIINNCKKNWVLNSTFIYQISVVLILLNLVIITWLIVFEEIFSKYKYSLIDDFTIWWLDYWHGLPCINIDFNSMYLIYNLLYYELLIFWAWICLIPIKNQWNSTFLNNNWYIKLLSVSYSIWD